MKAEFSPQQQRILKKINFRIRTAQYEEAIELLETGSPELTNSKNAMIGLAQLYVATGNYQSAIKLLRRLFAKDQDPYVTGMLALLLCTEERYEEAIVVAEEGGEETNSQFAIALANLELRRDLKKAEMILGKLTINDPKFAPFLFQVEILQGKFAQAQNTLKSLNEAVVSNYNSGIIDIRLQLPDNAKRTLEKLEEMFDQIDFENLYSKWKIQGYEEIDSETFKRKLTYFLTLGRALTISNPYLAYETLLKLETNQEVDHYLHLSLAALAARNGKEKEIIKGHINSALRYSSEIPIEFQKFMEDEQ